MSFRRHYSEPREEKQPGRDQDQDRQEGDDSPPELGPPELDSEPEYEPSVSVFVSEASESNTVFEGSEDEEEGEVGDRARPAAMHWADQEQEQLQEEPGSWPPAPAPHDSMDDDKEDDDEDVEDEDEEMDDDDDDQQ